MIAGHLHDALAQVRRLQALVLSRSLFEGYSGKARIVSGLAALLGASALSLPAVPPSPRIHLLGWGAVLGFATLVNYGALVNWIITEPRVRRQPALLKPALDALPALVVGGLLSLAAIRVGAWDLLFGIWMLLFGLAHMAYRQTLPGENYLVGLFYLAAGTACLLAPGIRFTTPWPMGLAFFLGETAGGLVLLRQHQQRNEEDA